MSSPLVPGKNSKSTNIGAGNSSPTSANFIPITVSSGVTVGGGGVVGLGVGGGSSVVCTRSVTGLFEHPIIITKITNPPPIIHRYINSSLPGTSYLQESTASCQYRILNR